MDSHTTSCVAKGKKMDDSVASDWMADTLPALLAEYEARNIFNTDEAVLFLF